MVKAGFIVEGASERIVVESPKFKELLSACDYELVTPVVDAKGGGNLLPQNIEVFINRLRHAGAESIFILTDLEDEAQVDTVRERVNHKDITFSFIAVKALEAWYLADSAAMNAWLGIDNFHEEAPEATSDKPWERIKQIAASLGKRGPGGKVVFSKKITFNYGFTVQSASMHPACESAKELVEYLRQ